MRWTEWPRWIGHRRYGTIPYWRWFVWYGPPPFRKAARKELDRLYLAYNRLHSDSPAGALRRIVARQAGTRIYRRRWNPGERVPSPTSHRRIPGVKEDRKELDAVFASSCALWLTQGRGLLPPDDPVLQQVEPVVWTQDEHAEIGEEKKPWPIALYLSVLIELFTNFPMTAVWKSRKVLATWAAVAHFTHTAQYSIGREFIFQCKKEDESIQRLLERAWYIYCQQPPWLRALHPARKVGNRIIFDGTGVHIVAVQQGSAPWRAPTVSGGLIDEAAFMDGLDEILAAAFAAVQGTKRTMPLRILSTPNGRDKFYRLVHDIEGRPLTPVQEAMRGAYKANEACPHKGMSWRMNSNGVLSIFVNYSADPEKDPCTPEGAAWKERVHQPYIADEPRWQREFEGSADIAAGTPVYASVFTDANLSESMVYQPGKIALEGWDFGFHHPAWVGGYVNDAGQLCILYEALGNQTLVHEFGEWMIRDFRSKFEGAPEWRSFGDPAGSQRSDKNQRSSIEILAGMGVYVGYRRLGIQDGLVTIRKMLCVRQDKKPGLLIHPRCRNLIDAMRGGYHYPEVKPDQPERESEVPFKDGYYEHLCDALRYLVTNIARPGGELVVQSEAPEPTRRRRVNPRTGY